MQALAGFPLLLGLAWALSDDRRAIPWRTVLAGIALQIALAVLLTRVGAARDAVLLLDRAADALQTATDQGTAFLFGYLGGGPLPFAETHPGGAFILAFKILPLVLVISAISALLFQWGVLQAVTGAFAAVLRRSLGIDGPLALAAAVHIFVGMIEAPLLVRPYLRTMQRGELFAMMTCGMAGVAGTVMVIYGAVLAPVVPNALGTIIVASVVSTPAALAVGALMVPFTRPVRGAGVALGAENRPAGSLDALVQGTAAGVAPLIGITTSLLVTISLVALINAGIGHVVAGWTLQALLAVPLRPVLWLIGIPWAQSEAAALLLGTKTILNEFVAYLALAGSGGEGLDGRSRLIMTYALCGFANLGSLGILVGGLVAMVPERRAEITLLGARSLVSGTIATLLSGAVAGLLAGE
ncbi:MAG: nucleoside transporter C-terminal domain-containing protein [Acetobacteraceae bacterium]|nr:nucleoside transporter C-terminal domain-containing protein [Acetobacteraceae bacterium]